MYFQSKSQEKQTEPEENQFKNLPTLVVNPNVQPHSCLLNRKISIAEKLFFRITQPCKCYENMSGPEEMAGPKV